MRAPIAIMSFNRPDYLAETLASLRAQSLGSLDGREIHLFQDGAVNLYSKMTYAEQADIDRSIALFRAAFPDGEVHYWGDNIGICENFYRAEGHLFAERGFEFAYFFEDDMVLSPVYLDMMEVLQRYAEATPQVAYFSAYGDYYAQPEEVRERRRELVNLDHHWAFGLRRAAWAKIREYLAPYYKLVRGNDYTRRDHRAIFDLFAAKEAVPGGSSQDAAKAWACDQLGLWRMRTFAPFAKYIGVKGAHMTQQAFDSIGFARTVVQKDVIKDLAFPDQAGINARLADQHAVFVNIFHNELPEMRRTLPVRKLNPMRLCTPEDVEYTYLLLLHRYPESQDIIDRHAGRTTVFRLVQEMSRSKEYLGICERIQKPQ